MQTNPIQSKRRIAPKLSVLLIALTSAFFVVACGGGGSAVGSDSSDVVRSASDGTSNSGSGSSSSGSNGTKSDDDNDDCTVTAPGTQVVAKHKGSDNDDNDDNDDDDDDDNEDDDDDCKTSATLPPLTAADLAAGSLGKTLWAANCFSCHGSDTHEVRTGARIMNAIAENKGGMRALSGVITATDAANIAIYAARPSSF